MIENAKNKAMDGVQNDEAPVKGATIKAVSLSMNEYHFPGTPDYQPISVRATTIEEATELWKTLRKPVKQEAPKEVAEVKEEKSDK